VPPSNACIEGGGTIVLTDCRSILEPSPPTSRGTPSNNAADESRHFSYLRRSRRS
jgi:hypothetical protein